MYSPAAQEQLCPEEESFGVTEVEVMMRRPSARPSTITSTI